MCLNNLHPAIKYMFEINLKWPFSTLLSIKLLDIEVILHSDNTIETDIYYKDTDAYHYLPYDSAYLKHCKDNLSYNLAKCIIVFVSNDEKVEMRLKELKNWLKDCNYTDSVINQSFYNAKVQGPVPLYR